MRYQCSLSYGQVRFWALDQFDSSADSYTVPLALRLSGNLDKEALNGALCDIVIRHESLRTVIASDQGKPVGYVQDIPEILQILESKDIDGFEGKDQPFFFENLVKNEASKEFDLSRDLMIRASLIDIAKGEWLLIIVIHHIACDGVSMGIFCRELAEAYDSRMSHKELGWSELPVSYADYAAWQREFIEESEEIVEQRDYWKSQISGVPDCLSLPTDFIRETDRLRTADYVPIELSRMVTSKIQECANKKNTTIFTIILAVYGLFLSRIAGQKDVMIGCPVAGRVLPEVENLIGFFVNTLPIKVSLQNNPDFSSYVDDVRQTVSDGLKNQDVPFDKIVEDVCKTRTLSHTPVFQVMLSWQDGNETSSKIAGLLIEPVPVKFNRAKFDLILSLAPQSNGQIAGMVEFDSSLFLQDRVKNWVDILIALFEKAPLFLSNRVPVSNLPLVNEIERRRLLDLNSPSKPSSIGKDVAPSPKTPIEIFEHNALKSPDLIALKTSDFQISYGQLDSRANQMARYLTSKHIGSGDVVAVALERSIEFIVSLIAVLKSGAAYLPIDTKYPTARVSFMLLDSRAKLLITNAEFYQSFDNESVHSVPDGIVQSTQSYLQPYSIFLIDGDSDLQELESHALEPLAVFERPSNNFPESLANLIYTSGTTGKPKGVCITNYNVVQMAYQPSYCHINEQSNTIFQSNISFDAATFEIWSALLNRAVLHISPANVEIAELFKTIRDFSIESLFLTTSLFVTAINVYPEVFRSVKQLLTGGDVVPPKQCGLY